MIRLCNELFSVDFNKMDSDHEKWWSVRLLTVLQSENAKSDTNNKSCCQKRNTYLKLIIAKQSLSFISLYWEGILFSITLRGTEITLPPPRLWECDCVSIINPLPWFVVWTYLQVMTSLQALGMTHPPQLETGQGWEPERGRGTLWLVGVALQSDREEEGTSRLPLTLQSHTSQDWSASVRRPTVYRLTR